MSDIPDIAGMANGYTAEDFANFVNDALGDSDEGLVRVPFEDFTIPDAAVMMGGTEIQGHQITYMQLFSGALEHFHGVEVTGLHATPTEAPPMSPWSMALEVTVKRSSAEPDVSETS